MLILTAMAQTRVAPTDKAGILSETETFRDKLRKRFRRKER